MQKQVSNRLRALTRASKLTGIVADVSALVASATGESGHPCAGDAGFLRVAGVRRVDLVGSGAGLPGGKHVVTREGERFATERRRPWDARRCARSCVRRPEDVGADRRKVGYGTASTFEGGSCEREESASGTRFTQIKRSEGA